jgi:hypothetical protein
MRGGLTRGDGVAVRGAEVGCAPIDVVTGAGRMVVVTAPFCVTVCETLPRSRMLPRGIPSPAESLWMVIRFWETPTLGFGPRATITVLLPGAVGGWGCLKRGGGLMIRGVPVHPPHEPWLPGCHIQP